MTEKKQTAQNTAKQTTPVQSPLATRTQETRHWAYSKCSGVHKR